MQTFIYEHLYPLLPYVFIAFLLQTLTKIPVAVAMAKQGEKGYDNNHPREQQKKLTGWGLRALGAHQNSFEAFPAFAIAVIISCLYGGPRDIAEPLCITFVAARILYTILYIADYSTLRSLVWFAGHGATIGLFILPWLSLS